MSESYFSFLSQGALIGLAVAAPVGPVSILCIQRTLAKGFISGFISGMGATTGDLIYACIGVLGLNTIAASLSSYKDELSLIGGLFLCYLGIKIFLDKSVIRSDKSDCLSSISETNKFLSHYASALLVNIVNPLTIFPFIAAFTQLYAANVRLSYISAGVFILGIFISAALWRTILSVITSLFASRFFMHQLYWVNRVAGIMIVALGFISIYSSQR